jgi:hypothetical protein
MIELGNDEVYYWTYARYPDLSHFDHPPMVGLVINLFTFNLTFDSEFFLRLASVVLGTLSTWLIYQAGKQIKNPLTGFYAACLFTASFYGSVLSGTFILPDTPQVFFWLLTLNLFLKALPDGDITSGNRNRILLAGFTAGMALLSKYHAVFLVAGASLFILFYNRKWLKTWQAWLAFLLFLASSLPILIWNARYDFISFTFHENRVGITEAGLQPDYLFTELAGQFFYNNPVNVVIILLALVAVIRGKRTISREHLGLILLTSLPLIVVFTSFSLFRPTLPHWSGPGYLGLLLLAAAFLSEPRKSNGPMPLLPWPIASALGFFLLVIIVAVGQIKTGFIPLSKWSGEDITYDLTGWKQLGEKFNAHAAVAENEGLIAKGAPLLTFRWFPAANFDYYLCRNDHRPVYAIGSLERIHKYAWINMEHGNLQPGSDAWYIALSDDYIHPAEHYGTLFDTIIPGDTLIITRRNDTIRNAFLYRLKGLRSEMKFHITP